MATRKLMSTPPGTTAVLWNKKTYLVGDVVPDDFPDNKLAYTPPVEGEAPAPAAAGEAGDEGKGKKKDKAPKVEKPKGDKAKGKVK